MINLPSLRPREREKDREGMVEVAAAGGSSSLSRLPLVRGGAAGSRRDAAIWRWPKRKEEMASTKKHRLHHWSHPPPLPTAARSSANDANISGFDSRPGVVTFSSNISTDIPLHETPGVSFDEYLCDRPRVFRAMFPDKRRSKRLNDVSPFRLCFRPSAPTVTTGSLQEEWRIQMLPIHFLFASANPVVVMRLRHKSSGEDYPPGVPGHATSVLVLQATRWELQGLQDIQMPPHFALSVQGVLYPDRSSSSRRLMGHLEMGISMILPPVLQLVPEGVLRSIADTLLRSLLKKMKHEVDVGLISDYAKFRREKLKKHGAAAQTPATSSELRGIS
ncbi:uncharacterized protein LOC135628589 isoform X1 [Musa acuminata AAA Group]|uniref:uncharacterized protein LOC135628589 isoform X1 n=1 Tax=Musa acuminata AAA Group TaxID=214697 RepID=UPI0031D4B9F1